MQSQFRFKTYINGYMDELEYNRTLYRYSVSTHFASQKIDNLFIQTRLHLKSMVVGQLSAQGHILTKEN